MPGNIFAICMEPPIKAHMAHLVIYTGRISLFADGVATALLHLAKALAGMLSILDFAAWQCLARRGQRWFVDVARPLEGLLRFARTSPPGELLTSTLRTTRS